MLPLLLPPAPVVYKGTITGLRISAVDGTAFIDNLPSAVTDLVNASPGSLEIQIYDSSNRMLKGVLKAAGTSEGLGDETITGWTNRTENLAYETLTVNANGHDIDALVNSSVSGVAYTNAAAVLYGLSKIVITPTITTGESPILSEANSGNGTIGTQIASVPNGTYYYTFGQLSSVRSLGLYNNNTNVNGSFAISLKPVTTPSSSGATIVSAKAGETYNFSYKNPSFTYNAASYYVVIKKIVGEVTVASGDITAGNALIDSTTANAFAAPVGVDLSAYQTGKYRLDLYSTASGVLWAQGFISATAPSGLADGGELNPDTTFDAGGWSGTGWVVSGGVATATNTTESVYRSMLTLPSSKLFKTVYEVSSFTSGKCAVRLSGINGAEKGATGTYTDYITGGASTNAGITGTSTPFTGSITSLSVKQLTMPAATGALLLSSYGGSRGFVFKHASFDPNAALSYKIVKVID
jgi:hypothetical protein